MIDFLLSHASDFLVILLSLIAVIISLFRAHVQETYASAAAINELVSSSHDLRERVNVLEENNQQKQEALDTLRVKAAQIPILEAQVHYLTEELARVKGKHQDERTRLLKVIKAKNREIARLKAEMQLI